MSNSTPPPEVKNETFLADVIRGLSCERKYIPSKYFYDKKGSELFEQITRLPEYYPTQAEHDLLVHHKQTLARLFSSPQKQPFRLLELGVGDGHKTKVLLKELLVQEMVFDYLPIDISSDALQTLERSLKKDLPLLDCRGMDADYFQLIRHCSLPTTKQARNVVLFLGANIGNFNAAEAQHFLSELSTRLSPRDLLLIGIDLKKDPQKIKLAYQDPQGITKAFNLNLLHRINRELGGDFDTSVFEHHACYDPTTGDCKSALLSKKAQEVVVGGQVFGFAQWEAIHTEVSRKYSPREVQQLAQKSGFRVKQDFIDMRGWFTDSLWEVV